MKLIPIYSVFSEEREAESSITYRSYGVLASDAEGRQLKMIRDVTTDRDELEKLVSLCNRLQLSLCHLDDVIEDFLAG